MTKLTPTPAGAVLVAIDMSKNRQEVLIERPEGGRRRRMTVMATRQDYDGFAEQLAAIGRPIVVGFEATGNYHRTLAHRLLTAGFESGSKTISAWCRNASREVISNPPVCLVARRGYHEGRRRPPAGTTTQGPRAGKASHRASLLPCLADVSNKRVDAPDFA
jgi:hypothetical protein